MNILLVLAHPDPMSFNHALTVAVRNALQSAGHHVDFHDLYAENFNPMLSTNEILYSSSVPDVIKRHCEELRNADGIVVVHPNWWGQPPAVLKGWIDRVFRPGVAFRSDESNSGEWVTVGLLKAKATLVLITSNTPDDREQSEFGNPLDTIWKRCIFGQCGVTNVHVRTFSVIGTSRPPQRQDWIRKATKLAVDLFPPGPHTERDTPESQGHEPLRGFVHPKN